MRISFSRSIPEEATRSGEAILRVQAERDVLLERLRNEADCLRSIESEMTLLRSAIEALCPWKTRQQLAESLRELVFRAFDLSGISVLEVDETAKRINCLHYFEAGAARHYPPRDYEMDPGLSGCVIQQRRSLYLRTTAESEALGAVQSPPELATGLVPSTYYGIPLFEETRIIGVLAFMSYPQDDFSPSRRILMDSLGRLLANAFSCRLSDNRSSQ